MVAKFRLHLPDDRGDHAGFCTEDEPQVGLVAACNRLVDLAEHEGENVRRRSDDAIAVALRLQGEREHFTRHL